MASRCTAILILLLTLLPAGPVGADFREGLWEITVRMEMPGAPAQPVVSRHCLRDDGQVRELLQKDQACEILKTDRDGDGASWTMKCRSGEGSIDGSGRMAYRGDRLEGAIRLTLRRQGASPLKITQRVSGRRLGDCP